MNRPSFGPLVGLALALLAGVACEALAIALRDAGGPAVLDRAARLERIALLAAFAGLAGIVAAGIARAGPRRLAERAGPIAAATGIAACLALAGGFLVLPPEAESIRRSMDPLTGRILPLGAAAVVALASIPIVQALMARVAARGALAVGGAIAVATTAAALASGGAVPDEDAPPDLFLITVDTLRADHLGCYGYPLPTSPALDALCAESIVFENAMSAAPQTIPSYASVFSGVLPPTHGVANNFLKLDAAVPLVTERLRERDYRTGAILSGTFPGGFAGLDRGLDLVVYRGITATSPILTPSDGLRSIAAALLAAANDELRRDASVTTDAAVDWIRHLSHAKPVFLHVYWAYPHASYDPPAAYRTLPEPDAAPELRDAIHLYDGEIRFTDTQIGRVLDAIAERAGSRRAWIVFTADHGEELGRRIPERDAPFFGHSLLVYDTSVRVPLVVRPGEDAGLAPRRHVPVVSTVSLASTLLEVAGGTPDPDWLPALPLRAPDARRAAYSAMRDPDDLSGSGALDRVSVRIDGWRLIENRRRAGGMELLRQGPEGEIPVPIADHREVFERLARALRAVYPEQGGDDTEPAPALSESERELLRALGYIE